MERKGTKCKESAAPLADGSVQEHIFARLRKSYVTVFCLSLIVLSASGVAGLRVFGTWDAHVYRELLEEMEENDSPAPFRLSPVVTNWDEQRAAYLEQNRHMSTTSKGKPRLFMITSSQAEQCPDPAGDFWLLKAYKNKMDYCRKHHIESYYNMGITDPAMVEFWVKLPLIHNIMLAHPEVEWIWWMDSDAIFTDMEFEIPLEKYQDHNLVIHGWPHKIFDEKSWVGLNTGSFLIRNCQWSLDVLDLWASFGENRGDHRRDMGKLFSQALTERKENYTSDDQSALVYLLNDMKDKIYPKVYLESAYYLHGYWVIVTEKYEEAMSKSHPGYGDDRWPFITHFVGCKPCANFSDYPRAECLKQMTRAFNFADNQVVEEFGFHHVSLESPILHRSRNDSVVGEGH